MMREVSLKTLLNVNIRDPSHDKNLPIKQTLIENLKIFHIQNSKASEKNQMGILKFLLN